jgi:4'-phosphopantetheinyl transferase
VNGVRLWTAHLESLSPGKIEELSANLDLAERARAAQFHFERDRQHYVATRGLLRCLLGAILKEHASAIALDYGTHGKPRLAVKRGSGSNIRFNLSHSAGWAMFALAQGREVGIDLESAARLDKNEEDLSRLATRILSARELPIWRSLPHADARYAAFLRAWTRKEAYAKATGQGVFDGLAGIEVILDAAAPEASLTISPPGGSDGLTSDWLLHDLLAPEGFAAALAVEQLSEENIAREGEAVFAAVGNA